MLSRRKFLRHEASFDEFGRARGGDPAPGTGQANPFGTIIAQERAGRESVEVLELDMRDAEEAHRTAATDEIATEADRAWSDLLVAQTHLLLVGRFEREAADWRAEANRLAVEPGGSMLAERARVEASRLMLVAERHRKAAETRQERGQQEMAEVRTMAQRAAPAAAGNPHPASGQQSEVMQRPGVRTVRRTIQPAPETPPGSPPGSPPASEPGAGQ